MTKKGRQLKMLYDQIVGNASSTGKDKIFVYPIEAGLGKTSIAVDALWALYEENPTMKSLVVVERISDANNLERELRGISVAVHSEREVADEIIKDAAVVIITHSRYKELCNTRNKKKRKYKCLIRGRHNLIIDEEFHPFEFAHIDQEGYRLVRNSIAEIDLSLLRPFDEVFSDIKDILIKIEAADLVTMHIVEPKPLDTVERIALRRIEAKVDAKAGDYGYFTMLKELHNEPANEQYAWTYKELKDLFRALREIRTSEFCVFDTRGLHCIGSGYEFCLLENNIMLDASASIMKLNHQNSKRQLIEMDRLTDHSRWKLTLHNTKSTKRAKQFNRKFYDGVATLIELKCADKDKRVLVIGSGDDVGCKSKPEGKLQRYHKECCETYKRQISFVNFGAMRGKNKWSEYNCNIIMHTPYRPSWYYVLVFKYYNPDYVLTDYDIQHSYSNKKGFEHPCFRDKKLDGFRESDLAASVYQAIKRINRDNYDNAEVHFISSNQNIIKILEKHLVDISIEEYILPSKKHAIEHKQKYNREEESPVRVRLRALFVEMAEGKHRAHECADSPGYYKKKWCMSQIGCNGHFSRYLESVEEYMKELGIVHNQHKIIITKFLEKD